MPRKSHENISPVRSEKETNENVEQVKSFVEEAFQQSKEQQQKSVSSKKCFGSTSASCSSEECCFLKQMKTIAYWENPQKSGGIFAMLFFSFYLLFLGPFTLLTLISYFFLTVLFTSFVYVNGNILLAAFQGRPVLNPLEKYFEKTELNFSQDFVSNTSSHFFAGLNVSLNRLKDIFLIKSNFQSLKAAFVFYLFAMIGKIFSFPMILFFSLFGFFSLPKFYQVYQNEINSFFMKLSLIFHQFSAKISEKVNLILPPFLKTKSD
eukprot:Sdes_comp9433_c0_seq1m897